MNNWIEEAEKRQELKERALSEEKEKKDKNWNDNHDKLKPVLNEFIELVERISRISIEERSPCIEIGHTHLKGEDNYEFFGSANVPKEHSIIPIISAKPIMCWRRVHFRMTNKLGMVKLNLYEKFGAESDGDHGETQKRKFIVKINKVDSVAILDMVSWIAFKINTEEFYTKLPLGTNGKGLGKKDKRCFIATAVYGSPNCREIDVLRDFRDKYLLSVAPGRLFVRTYYKLSPPIAQYISESSFLKGIIRKLIIHPLVVLAQRLRY